MDINELFTQQGMRNATSAWRDQHMEDSRQYGQLADIIRRRLQQTPITGDRWYDKRLRAWRVARHARSMQRHSRKIAAQAEALDASFLNRVVNLPERRAVEASRKAEKKQQRAANAGAFVAKSLDKSARALAGDAVKPQVGGVQEGQQAPQYLDAQPYQFPMAAGDDSSWPRDIRDLFPQGGGK